MNRKQSFESPYIDILDLSYSPSRKTDYHCDRWPRISIIVSGGVREVVGNKEELGTPMSIIVKPNDARHLNEFSPEGARIVSVVWNVDQAPDIFDLPELDTWRWFHSTQHAAAAIQFLRRLKSAKNRQERTANIVDLVASFSMLDPSENKEPPRWLRRIEERLCDAYDQPLLVQDLAAEAEVHPVYLARVFRKYYGCSIKDYLQQIRVRRAIQPITCPELPLAHVAFDEGFADQSHLNRLFKRELKISPGQFRKLTQEVSFVQDKITN